MTRVNHQAVARHYAARPHLWSELIRFDADSRWYRRIAEDDGAEVWLLTWLPGQGTDLHDHGGSSGGFTVVDGELTEERLDGHRSLRPHLLAPGQGRRFGPHYIHRVSNRGARPAVSIHAYSPALTSMTRYELSPEGLRTIDVDLAGTW